MILDHFVKWLQQIDLVSSASPRASRGVAERMVDTLPPARFCAICLLRVFHELIRGTPNGQYYYFPLRKCPGLLKDKLDATQGPEPRLLAQNVCPSHCSILGTNLYFLLLPALLVPLSLNLDGTLLALGDRPLVPEARCHPIGSLCPVPALPRAEVSSVGQCLGPL